MPLKKRKGVCSTRYCTRPLYKETGLCRHHHVGKTSAESKKLKEEGDSRAPCAWAMGRICRTRPLKHFEKANVVSGLGGVCAFGTRPRFPVEPPWEKMMPNPRPLSCRSWNVYDPAMRKKFGMEPITGDEPRVLRVSTCSGTRARKEPPTSFNLEGTVTREGVVCLGGEMR